MLDYKNLSHRVEFSTLSCEAKKERFQKMVDMLLEDHNVMNNPYFNQNETRQKLNFWANNLLAFGKGRYKTDFGNHYGGLKLFFLNWLKALKTKRLQK